MKYWHYLAIGAAAGLASLALIPVERIAPVPGDMPVAAVRALAIVQPALLTVLALFVGIRLTGRFGLDAPLCRAWAAGRGGAAVFFRQIGPAMVVALLTAFILVAYDAATADIFERAAVSNPAIAAMASLEISLVTGMLYGGIVEELLMRWGLMTVLLWIAWRLAGRPAALPEGIYWAAILGAAAIFAAGHLPVTYALFDLPPPMLLAYVLAGNFVPGVAFGWLFRRYGIESSMIAHAGGHLLGATGLVIAG